MGTIARTGSALAAKQKERAPEWGRGQRVGRQLPFGPQLSAPAPKGGRLHPPSDELESSRAEPELEWRRPNWPFVLQTICCHNWLILFSSLIGSPSVETIAQQANAEPLFGQQQRQAPPPPVWSAGRPRWPLFRRSNCRIPRIPSACLDGPSAWIGRAGGGQVGPLAADLAGRGQDERLMMSAACCGRIRIKEWAANLAEPRAAKLKPLSPARSPGRLGRFDPV